MLSFISIRWRLILFHVLTMLGIGAVLVIGLFAVFGIAVSESVEQLASSRANEAARIIESTGGLADADLVSLNRDSVIIIALDREGRVVTQTGSGLPDGSRVEDDLWRTVLATGKGTGAPGQGRFDLWDDAAYHLHAEPVNAPESGIAIVEAAVNYDRVGADQFTWITLGFAGFGILAFILVTIGSYYLVRYSLSPVRAIADAAAEISAVDLSRRLPVRSRRDELGQLAMTFNDLLGRLDSAFRDRERVLEQQRRFVADASHELRTPLTSILGYARMLRTWGLERPEMAREAVSSLEQEAIRMEALVEGMLQLARGDEGVPMRQEEHDLGEVILRAIDPILASNDDGITIDADLTCLTCLTDLSKDVVAWVDADQIHQALMILLDNAMKFSPSGGTVRVRLQPRGDVVDICVIDEGPGIPPEIQDRIFERFFRAEASRTTRGTGLGLSIARAIADRHGGSLTVESTPGNGATFRLRIPRRNVPQAIGAMLAPTA